MASFNASKRSYIWLERLSRTKNETHVSQTHKNSKLRAKPLLQLKINATKRYIQFVTRHSLFLMLFLRTSDIKQD